jgi:hypothetical protein
MLTPSNGCVWIGIATTGAADSKAATASAKWSDFDLAALCDCVDATSGRTARLGSAGGRVLVFWVLPNGSTADVSFRNIGGDTEAESGDATVAFAPEKAVACAIANTFGLAGETEADGALAGKLVNCRFRTSTTSRMLMLPLPSTSSNGE